MTPEIPGESLTFQRAYNGWYESTALQRLTCLLPRRGVPLPDRAWGAGCGSSIQRRVLALLLVSLATNYSAAFYHRLKRVLSIAYRQRTFDLTRRSLVW